MTDQWLQQIRDWSLRRFLSPLNAPFGLQRVLVRGRSEIREDWREEARLVFLISIIPSMLIGLVLIIWVYSAITALRPLFGRNELFVMASCLFMFVLAFFLLSWFRAVRGLSREIVFTSDAATTTWRWHGKETSSIRTPLREIPPLQICKIPANGRSRQMFAMVLHVGDRLFCLACRGKREKLTKDLEDLPTWLAALGCEDGPPLTRVVH